MKPALRRFFLENWLLKASALIIALVLWLFVHVNPGPERVVAVPLEVRVPRQMEILGPRPASVEVAMRGVAVTNSWFSQPLPSCVVDLQNATEGDHVVTLTPANIKISQGTGIEILRINPVRLDIRLEPTISREVPIVVPFKGGLPAGVEIYSQVIRPATVIITGASSRITPVKQVETMPVTLTRNQGEERFFLNLNLPDASIRTSVNTPIQLQLNVGPQRRAYKVSNIPVTVEGGNYVIKPKDIDIHIFAPPDYIKNVSATNFRAVIHAGAFNPAKLPARVEPVVQILNNPDGATEIRAIDPAEIQIQRKR